MNLQKKTRLKLWVLMDCLILSSLTVFGQSYGPEMITNGDFGTTISQGRNGEDPSRNEHIYYASDGTTAVYPLGGTNKTYQPHQSVNPNVTLGYPLGDISSYHWGLNETWGGFEVPYAGANQQPYIPQAPNNGSYVIATSTIGMYNKAIAGEPWAILYDQHETDKTNPTNYFMVVNADADMSKLFLSERVAVTNGQKYRISFDIARLNRDNQNPNIGIVVSNTKAGLATDPIIFSSGLITTLGEWHTYYFDYVIFEATDSIYIGFRNNVAGGQGNDLALDNLSMKPVLATLSVSANGNDCNNAAFEMSADIENGFKNEWKTNPFPQYTHAWAIDHGLIPNSGVNVAAPSDNIKMKRSYYYHFNWQKLNDVTNQYEDIPAATTLHYTTNLAGSYRLKVWGERKTHVFNGSAIYLDSLSNTCTTAIFPMFSTPINVISNTAGCIEVPRPRAYDDYYSVGMDTPLSVGSSNGLLSNDEAAQGGDLSVTTFSVTEFQIGTQSFAAGERALITQGSGTSSTIIGSIKINIDGSFVFEPAPGFSGPVPDVTYIVMEEGSGRDTANVHITVSAVSYDASCSNCPVKLTVSTATATKVYALYEGEATTPLLPAINSSAPVSFSATAGTHSYKVKLVSDASVLDQRDVTVHPASATWNVANNSTTWGNKLNWHTDNVDSGYPIWCTDVTIPSRVSLYPTAKNGDACRDITFKPGASVEQVQRLLYRKAYVEYLPERNIWQFTSAPLRYMYSADYHADRSWSDAISPKTFMMNFGATTTVNPDGTDGQAVGDFTRPFAALSEALPAAGAFAHWVNGANVNGLNYLDGNFPTGTPYLFPRRNADESDVTYAYHIQNTGTWLNTIERLNRGDSLSIADNATWETNHDNLSAAQKDNRFRFAFEALDKHKFTATVNSDGFAFVGNPYMSRLDFAALQAANSAALEPYYYSFEFAAGTLEPTTITGLSTSDDASLTIAPMQAFFVKFTGNNSQIDFAPASTLLGPAPAAQAAPHRRNAAVQAMDIVRLKLQDAADIVLNQTLLTISQPNATENSTNNNVAKLFAPSTAIAEIYTQTSDNRNLDIQQIDAMNAEQLIPIGITAYQAGTFILSATVNENAANSTMAIYDAWTGTNYPIGQTNVSFSVNAGTIEGRFFLKIAGLPSVVTDSEQHNDNLLSVYNTAESFVITSANTALTKVSIADVSGRIIYERSAIGAQSATIPYSAMNNTSGIYLVTVSSNQQTRVFKMIKK